jgi:hypothetical protein
MAGLNQQNTETNYRLSYAFRASDAAECEHVVSEVRAIASEVVRAIVEEEEESGQALAPGASGVAHRLELAVMRRIEQLSALVQEIWRHTRRELHGLPHTEHTPIMALHSYSMALDATIKAFMHEMLWLHRVEYSLWTEHASHHGDHLHDYIEGAFAAMMNKTMSVARTLASVLRAPGLCSDWAKVHDHILNGTRAAEWADSRDVIRAYESNSMRTPVSELLHPCRTNRQVGHLRGSDQIYGTASDVVASQLQRAARASHDTRNAADFVSRDWHSQSGLQSLLGAVDMGVRSESARSGALGLAASRHNPPSYAHVTGQRRRLRLGAEADTAMRDNLLRAMQLGGRRSNNSGSGATTAASTSSNMPRSEFYIRQSQPATGDGGVAATSDEGALLRASDSRHAAGGAHTGTPARHTVIEPGVHPGGYVPPLRHEGQNPERSPGGFQPLISPDD